MPAASAGNILFTTVVAKSESTYGTAATMTSGGRKLLASPTGIITIGQEWDWGDDRTVGLRNKVLTGGGTLISSAPEVSLDVPAVSIGELPVWLSGIRTVTPSGAGPYTWDFKPTLTSTSNSPKSMTFVVGDGVQQYLLNYVLPTEISIKADRSGLTSLSASAFANSIAKNSDALAAPVPTSKMLSGRLWKLFTYATAADFSTDIAAGTPTGGTQYTYLLDFDLKLMSGLTNQAYLNGTTSWSTHAETDQIGGDVSFTVTSNAAAVTSWYDKLGTAQYARLTWTDGTYTVHILAAFQVSDVQPMAGDEDGLTTMTVSGKLAYDATAAAVWRCVVVSDLATLP